MEELEYLVKFRYINSGKEAHEIVKILPDENIGKVLQENWRGLLCESGGLRNILTIQKLPITTSIETAKAVEEDHKSCKACGEMYMKCGCHG